MIQHRWVQGFHLNARGVFFGGQMLSWVDEDCTMVAFNSCREGAILTTVGFDRINFYKPCYRGDRLRFEYHLADVGKTSMTIFCEVTNQHKELIFTGLSTLVCLDGDKPTQIEKFIIEKPNGKYAEYIKALKEQRKCLPEPK